MGSSSDDFAWIKRLAFGFAGTSSSGDFAWIKRLAFGFAGTGSSGDFAWINGARLWLCRDGLADASLGFKGTGDLTPQWLSLPLRSSSITGFAL